MSYLKVLIVDDEKPAREIISQLISWEELGYYICAQAKNGKEAYEKYLQFRPDLIITDIQMPVMNGLEFIRKIRENDLEQRIVILSCYEEFSYAKEAIKMNVVDYLIKDVLKKEDLYQLLFNIKQKNFISKQNTIETVNSDVIKIRKTDDKFKNFILNLIENRPSDYYFVMEEDKTYQLLLISIDEYNNNHEKNNTTRKEYAKNKVFQTLGNFNNINDINNIETFAYIGDGKFVVLTKMQKSNSEKLFMEESGDIANKIRENYQNIDNSLTITIVIGKAIYKKEDIKKRYKEAEETLNYRFFIGKGKNLFNNISVSKITKVTESMIKQSVKDIEREIENSDFGILKDIVEELYNKRLKGFMQYNYLKEINGKLILIISNYCNQYEIDYSKVFNKSYIPLEDVNNFDTVEEMNKCFNDYFKSLINIKNEKNRYSRHISDTIQYINENFFRKITLEEVSEVLNLHKVYVSRLFKEETGMTITSYILKVRMDKAMELIENTNMKFYEIGEKVGYNNSQRFFVAFKKHIGETPKKYRLNHK